MSKFDPAGQFEPTSSAQWTVQLTLLGRRNGEPVPGVGSTVYRGSFASYSVAREAVDAWERDPDFIWKARAYHRGEQ